MVLGFLFLGRPNLGPYQLNNTIARRLTAKPDAKYVVQTLYRFAGQGVIRKLWDVITLDAGARPLCLTFSLNPPAPSRILAVMRPKLNGRAGVSKTSGCGFESHRAHIG